MEDTTMDWEKIFYKEFKCTCNNECTSVSREDCLDDIKEFIENLLSSQEQRLNTLAQQKVLSENALTRDAVIDEISRNMSYESFIPYHF